MIDDILCFLGSRGLRYTKGSMLKIADYLNAMIKDNRILIVYDDEGNINTFLSFSICYDFIDYYNKPHWTYLSHEPEGTIVYIEEFVTKSWNKNLRKSVERVLIRRHPSIIMGAWHRPTKHNDRIIYYDIKENCYVSDKDFERQGFF